MKGKTDNIGDLTQLQTIVKSSVVAAVNELKGKTDNIGDLTQLETIVKSSVVAAINELKGKTDEIGDLTQLQTTIKSSVVAAINELKGKTDEIGDLTQLETIVKSSVVAAINELKGKTDEIGDLTQLQTTIKTNLVNAINEIKNGTYTKTETDTLLNGKLNTSLKGVANGLAELNGSGKVPSSQLPSFVDDVIEGYYYNNKFYLDNAHTTEITPEDGKIYVDLTSNKTYRWSGSTYIEISQSLVLGETSSTAYRGDKGKEAYDRSIQNEQNIVELEEDLETIEEDLETIEEDLYGEIDAQITSTPAILSGTKEGRDLSIKKIYGYITQETREGYNLIKNNNVNGIIVNANNISGEGSYLALADVEAETDYTISLKKSRISGVTISNSTLYKVARIEFYNNSTFLSQIEGDTTTFSSGSRALLNIFTTPTNCNNVKISLFNNNGDSNYNTLVEEVMLVKGTYTAETIPNFEPYGAMPSLDYKSPVKVVDGEYEFQIQNENLLDLGEKNISLNGVNSVIKHSKIVLNGTTNSASNVIDGTRVDIFYLKGNYVLKCNKLNTISNADYAIYLSFYYKDGTREQKSFATNEALSLKYLNFTDDIDHVAYYIYCNKSGAVFNNVEIEVQLVKGTNAPQQYIEAKTQFQSIDTSSNPLYSENDCYKYLTSEQATALGLNTGAGWYAYNEWYKYVFNGNETGGIHNNHRLALNCNSLNIPIPYGSSSNSAIAEMYSNIANARSNNNTWNVTDKDIMSMCLESDSEKTLYFSLSGLTTLTQYQNALNGNYVIYKMKNPTYTKITDTDLINSLNAIQELKQYEDTTIITIGDIYRFDLAYDGDRIEVLLDDVANLKTGKEDKSNKKTELNSNLTNDDYLGAKTVYDALVERDIKIAELKEENQELINDHPSITGKSTNLNLQKTGNLPMKIVPYGNISQETREGYNLINTETFTTFTNNGVTFTRNSDGTILVNGTANENGAEINVLTGNTSTGNNNNNIILEANETYTLSGNKNGNSSTVRLMIHKSNYTNVKEATGINTTFTQTDSANISAVRIIVTAGAVINNFIVSPMLIKGNDKTKPYEQYGISPSIEYKSPVKVVDGEYSIKVKNDNILNPILPTTTLNGITCTNNGNGTYTLNGTATYATTFKLLENLSLNGTFKLTGCPSGLSTATSFLQLNSANVAYTETGSGVTCTLQSIDIYDLRISVKAGYTCNNLLFKPMLTEDTTKTYNDFISYEEQTQTIDTSPNPLYSENDCYKYLTSEEATFLGLNTGEGWYVYNEWGKVVLNGNENWTKSDVTTVDRFVFNNSNYLSSISSLCNYFKTGHTNNTNIGQWFNNMGVQFVFNLSEFGTTTLEQWKTWLSTHNLVLLQPLANPTYTKITDTDLINSLEALKDMQSYYDVTNISQTHLDGQADMIINAKALKSLKAMQSEIDNLDSRLSLLE